MSGGSYNYAYSHIENLAVEIQPKNALRKAFIKHLMKVAKAAHDIEWVDSSDKSEGDEDVAIRAVLGVNSDKEELKIIVEEAQEALNNLQQILVRVKQNENP